MVNRLLKINCNFCVNRDAMRLPLAIAEFSCSSAGSVSDLLMRNAGFSHNTFSDIVTSIPDENIVTSLLSTSRHKPISFSLFTTFQKLLFLNVDSGEVTMFSARIEVTMFQMILSKEPASLINRSPAE